MTFEEWFEKEPMPKSYHDMAKAFYLLNKELSKLAWEYQQAIIDNLKQDIKELIELGTDQVVTEKILRLEEALEMEKLRTEEYFERWDNLRKGQE